MANWQHPKDFAARSQNRQTNENQFRRLPPSPPTKFVEIPNDCRALTESMHLSANSVFGSDFSQRFQRSQVPEEAKFPLQVAFPTGPALLDSAGSPLY
jgi:hypothetical protein